MIQHNLLCRDLIEGYSSRRRRSAGREIVPHLHMVICFFVKGRGGVQGQECLDLTVSLFRSPLLVRIQDLFYLMAEAPNEALITRKIFEYGDSSFENPPRVLQDLCIITFLPCLRIWYISFKRRKQTILSR